MAQRILTSKTKPAAPQGGAPNCEGEKISVYPVPLSRFSPTVDKEIHMEGSIKAPAEPSMNIDESDSSPARYRITTYFRPMSDVVDERLDEQCSRLMEVEENIEAAKEAWSRSGLVCGVEVGKQTESLEASKQMWSLLKGAAETLRDIANRIHPRAICEQGEDSMDVVSERLDAKGAAAA
jgi:hypothetical protein